jgi:hypothetical protein
VGTVEGLVATGAIGTVLAFAVTLVRIAIGSERRRADDWRTVARTSNAANAVLSTNVEKLISSVEQLAASQRETTALLQTIAARREAA